ncbi:hypothetical protein EV586_101702 [Tumebacillus sp. BK434]|uniref:hypothetical protein n=1 Tax=Tumebacillus sp. BK434 TaxID=2512169 RepID=UPI00104460DC|nr:hypothetical protein [Tumebacillus sp. BK434]TCP59483.1 hypothetical protein EV586_101702 [Tumebacillus sp. BK434]
MDVQKSSLGFAEISHFAMKDDKGTVEFAVIPLPPQYLLGMAMGSKLVILSAPYEGTALFQAGVTADEVQARFQLPSREEGVRLSVMLTTAFMEMPGAGHTPHIIF